MPLDLIFLLYIQQDFLRCSSSLFFYLYENFWWMSQKKGLSTDFCFFLPMFTFCEFSKCVLHPTFFTARGGLGVPSTATPNPTHGVDMLNVLKTWQLQDETNKKKAFLKWMLFFILHVYCNVVIYSSFIDFIWWAIYWKSLKRQVHMNDQGMIKQQLLLTNKVVGKKTVWIILTWFTRTINIFQWNV